MGLKKRLTAVGIIATAAVLTFVVAKSGLAITERQESIFSHNEKETLYLWYTDEALTSYLSSAAVAYNENHDVRVIPVLETGLEYLEKINKASLETNAPDMFIVGHDSLEKAYLAGLASEVEPSQRIIMDEEYIGTGLKAATYKDKLIGYPFYFETSALLYNRTYLEDMAKGQLEAQIVLDAEEAGTLEPDATATPTADTQAADASATGGQAQATGENTVAEDELETQFTEEQIEAKIQELLPTTVEEIRTFADNYDAPEQVEGVFKWDVTDIFYNYFFVGNAINMGGEAGWDTAQIDIYNLNAIKSMRVYQELNQFFSIETSESSYESILDEFMAGKMVFTMATTDAVFRLEHAQSDGLFDYEYGITLTPDINEEMKTRSLSVTNCVVINGYSENKEAANDFAYYLTTEYNNILYARTGKVSAAKNVDYGYDELNAFAAEYEKSISMPKMLETSNFWVQLEGAFSEIWNGADANEELRALSETMKEQVIGQEYDEEYLDEPDEQKEETEYLDEEYYRNQALSENGE